MDSHSRRTTVIALLLACVATTAIAAPSVLQRGYDAGVTGANLSETQLNTTTVGPNTFGQLFTLPLDEKPYAQPLYVPNVTIPGLGTHNVLYVATMNDSVYAFDADAGGAPLWSVNLASLFSTTAIPWGQFNLPPNTPPVGNLGILSTPVIDPATNVMYVVAATLEGGDDCLPAARARHHDRLRALWPRRADHRQLQRRHVPAALPDPAGVAGARRQRGRIRFRRDASRNSPATTAAGCSRTTS